jgi:hypothetical protein
MPFGTLDTAYIDFPAGVDVAYLRGLQTAAGVDMTRVISELDSRLAAANVTADPIVASTSAVTTEAYTDTSSASNFKARKHSEYTPPRPQLNENSGVMIPISYWDLSFQFTEDGLEAMSLNRILQNIDGAVNGMKYNQRLEALTRMFSMAEVRVDDKTSVLSPGFAGSGSGNNVFTTPYPNGTALGAGYTHYARVASGGLAAGIKAGLRNLKRWHQGPFDMLAGQDMIDLVTADSNFVEGGSTLVRQGANVAEALVDPDLYLGVFMKEIRVRKPLLETNDPNIAIYKSDGAFAATNPLAYRYDEKTGRNMFAKYRAFYPLDQAICLQKYGFGVNDRTKAYLIRVDASGNYVDPVFA